MVGVEANLKSVFSDVQELGIKALFVAVLAGGSALFLSPFFAMDTTNIIGIIVALVAIVLVIFLAKMSDVTFDDMNIFDLVMLFAMVGIIGSIIGLFAPQLSGVLLNVENPTISSLLLTFLWIGIAEVLTARIQDLF